MVLPVLSLENISYIYPDETIALRDVSLSIDQGKKIALLGQNGAGKSTLLLLFNGLLKPTRGQIAFKGKKLSYTRKEIQCLRQQVGVVFQNPDMQLFSTSVYEDIKFGPRNLGMLPEELERAVEKAMNVTETDELKDKPPHRLSMGQKKLVAIAGIVAMKPELLVLDEPTSGLDPYYFRKIMRVLDHLHHENSTIVLSTHDVNLAYEWAEEVIVLKKGQILAKGCPAVVFQNQEVLEHSHLEQPWVMQVYDRLIESASPLKRQYPESKEALFEEIKAFLKAHLI